MELKPGYKQTEVGVIPEDWVEKQTGDLISFQGGSQPDKSFFSNAPKKNWIRLIQIRDYKNDKYVTYVPQKLARRFCTQDDIMIGRYGPPVFQILRGIEGAYNVALIKAIVSPEISKTYAYYFLKQEKLFLFIDKLSRRTSGQTGVDLLELRKYPFPLPPTKAEQEAIAGALSDADKLIASLEQLIEKKRMIKLGAMQELLTGKKRLPGFQQNPGYKQTEVGEIPEDWEVVKVSEFGNVVTGGTPSTIQQEFWNGTYPWVTPTDIHQEAYISITERTVTEAGISMLRRLPAGSVLVTCIASIGKNVILTKEGACNQQINAVIPNIKFSSEYLYYTFEQNKSYLKSSAGITATSIISKASFEEMLFAVTPSLSEQEAIASVLSDMDAEIDALEEKLEKARKIKAGMMHNLLTGTIRLV